MEMKFREAGDSSQFLEFHLAIQVPAQMVDDPINSLCVLAVGLGLFAGHGVICSIADEKTKAAKGKIPWCHSLGVDVNSLSKTRKGPSRTS
jgi:hypothetical protein